MFSPGLTSASIVFDIAAIPEAIARAALPPVAETIFDSRYSTDGLLDLEYAWAGFLS